jgi:hypothetical protein
MTLEEAVTLLREAHKTAVGYECWDCGIDEQPVWERIAAALAAYERGAEEHKARLDRVWWDALHQASREGLDLSETVRRADAAKEREQGDK